MIRGNRIPFFGKPPVTADGENRSVKLLPVHETVANGRMGKQGEWVCRPGYEIRHNLDTTATVIHLARHNGLVAITDRGEVFRSKDEHFRVSELLDGGLTGPYEPMSVEHDGELVVCDGGDPMVVLEDRVRKLGIPRISPGVARTSLLTRGGLKAGTYRYYVTMTTVAGESLVGPSSAIVTVRDGTYYGVRIELPSMTDEDRKFVLSWSVYREDYLAKESLRLVGTADIDSWVIEDLVDEIAGDPPTEDGSASTPPRATECAVVGDYFVYAGHDPYEIGWSHPGNHNYHPGGNFTSVPLDGGTLQTIRGVTKTLLVFRTNTVDLFALTGGSDVFALRLSYPRGCLAKKSVVMVGGSQPYWLGNDHIFYRVTGGAPEPIGDFEQNFVCGLESPESCTGKDFPREKCVRWFFPVDGVCLGYNYGKGHFFRDYSWNGDKEIPLGIHGVVQTANSDTLVGLSEGRIGEWSDTHATDMGLRIRTIRAFTMPLTQDGRQARANALVFRHDRGTRDIRGPFHPDIEEWALTGVGNAFLNPKIGKLVKIRVSEGVYDIYICIRDHSAEEHPAQPGQSGDWQPYWRKVVPDDDTSIIVRAGFDQGPVVFEKRLDVGQAGQSGTYSVVGPCGLGREMRIEIERSSQIPFAFTGGAVIAQPLGDGV